MSIFQIVGLFFIAVLLFVISIYMWYAAVTTSPKHELKKRLRRLAVDESNRRFPSELRIEILQGMSPFDRALFKFRPISALDRLIDKAGLRIDVRTMLFAILACAVVAAIIGIALERSPLLPFALAPLGGLLPVIYLKYLKSRRLYRFTEQFPDTLSMIARSLEAGHSFTAAVNLVSKEMPEPVAGLFRTAYEEQALGVSTREAVAHMADRIESTDLRFFIMAINIHREIGGSLAEVLGRLAKTIRERLTIRRQVKVYTAQARLSGYILAVTPFLMGLFFYFSSPGYVEELFNSHIGRMAIVLAIAAQVVGFLIIRRIVNIRI